jgi:hypothetical protein
MDPVVIFTPLTCGTLAMIAWDGGAIWLLMIADILYEYDPVTRLPLVVATVAVNLDGVSDMVPVTIGANVGTIDPRLACEPSTTFCGGKWDWIFIPLGAIVVSQK